ARDISEGGRRLHVGSRVAELRIVPDVEGFCAEGEPQALTDLEDLVDRGVRRELMRSTQDVTAGVPVPIKRWNGERSDVDTRGQVPGAAIPCRRLDDIGAVWSLAAGIRGVGGGRNAERSSAL